ELSGKRLVQVSDLHAGPTVDSDYLRAALASLADLDPDWIVLTGDFMTCGIDTVAVDEAARVIEALPAARRGCAAVLGNHDYGHNWQNQDAGALLCRRLEEAGVTVLRNEQRVFAGLTIAGIDDYWGPNFRPSDALAG